MNEFLFGFLVGGFFVAALSTLFTWKRKSSCGVEYCSSRLDPRCVTGNCRWHCHLHCADVCLKAWKDSDAAATIAKQAMNRARG